MVISACRILTLPNVKTTGFVKVSVVPGTCACEYAKINHVFSRGNVFYIISLGYFEANISGCVCFDLFFCSVFAGRLKKSVPCTREERTATRKERGGSSFSGIVTMRQPTEDLLFAKDDQSSRGRWVGILQQPG